MNASRSPTRALTLKRDQSTTSSHSVDNRSGPWQTFLLFDTWVGGKTEMPKYQISAWREWLEEMIRNETHFPFSKTKQLQNRAAIAPRKPATQSKNNAQMNGGEKVKVIYSDISPSQIVGPIFCLQGEFRAENVSRRELHSFHSWLLKSDRSESKHFAFGKIVHSFTHSHSQSNGRKGTKSDVILPSCR